MPFLNLSYDSRSLTALIFGGDPVEAAGRSAVWGASAEAESRMREGTTALGNIREEYGRARVCTA